MNTLNINISPNEILKYIMNYERQINEHQNILTVIKDT